jgi:hypothetical protein
LPRKKRVTRAVGYDLNAAKEPGTSEQCYEQPQAKDFQASIPANSGACAMFHRTHHNPLSIEGLAVDKRFSQKNVDTSKVSSDEKQRPASRGMESKRS